MRLKSGQKPTVRAPSNKSFRTKRTLGKKAKQNRPMPVWFRMKSETTKPYNTKRRNWRHSKLNL